MVKKVRKASQARPRTGGLGKRPNTSHVKQVAKHEKDPMADKVVGSELDNDDIDVIILN
jgi:hypothetical protein